MAPLAQERATRKCQRQGPGVQLRAFEDTQIKIRDQTPPDRPTPNLLLRQYRDADLAAVLSAREDASRLVHPFIADQYFAPERERPLYIALSNTLIGVFTLLTAGIGFIAEWFNREVLLLFFIGMLLISLYWTYRLKEV